jgi:hypothetical protein
MRPFLICLVAIVATLAAATPSLAKHHHTIKSSYSSYPGCVCHFGYGDAGCTSDTACEGEGGKCSEACFIQKPQDYIDR